MSTLSVPLLINGGEGKPTLDNLSSRELFLDLTNKYLYACFCDPKDATETPKAVETVRVQKSDETDLLKCDKFEINARLQKFIVGSMYFDGSKFTSNTTFTLDQTSISNLQKLVLKKGTKLFGSKEDMPSNPEEGQVFFMLSGTKLS